MNGNLFYTPRRRSVSLTALIDVVFILLMFFMLTSSFTRERQLELASPVASNDIPATSPRQLVLQHSGELTLMDDTPIALTDNSISTDFTHDQPLIIRPVADADVQAIVSAFARLKALGFNQLSLGNPVVSHAEGMQP